MADRGFAISQEVCDALNLPAQKVTRLSLHFDPSDVVRVDVELLPDSDELKEASRVFATYKFKAEQ